MVSENWRCGVEKSTHLVSEAVSAKPPQMPTVAEKIHKIITELNKYLPIKSKPLPSAVHHKVIISNYWMGLLKMHPVWSLERLAKPM